jgi:glucose-1-phosphate adenylyltransferase
MPEEPPAGLVPVAAVRGVGEQALLEVAAQDVEELVLLGDVEPGQAVRLEIEEQPVLLVGEAVDERGAEGVSCRLVERGEAEVYDFAANEVPGATDRDRGYWRDVGTLDAFWEANMDLISIDPVFNLYNREWPILTYHEPVPPAKFVFEDPGRTGHALDSMVCAGVVVSGAEVRRSVISPNVHLHSRALVQDSVLFPGVDVGRDAIVRRAIVDKNVRIEAGAKVGVDPEHDRERFAISAGGIVVIGKGAVVTA